MVKNSDVKSSDIKSSDLGAPVALPPATVTGPTRGIWTTEFWITFGSLVGAFALAMGFVKPADASNFNGALTDTVTAAFALLGAAWKAGHYIQSRTAVKTGGDVDLFAMNRPSSLLLPSSPLTSPGKP